MEEEEEEAAAAVVGVAVVGRGGLEGEATEAVRSPVGHARWRGHWPTQI